MDEVWVTSSREKKSLINSNVETPIHCTSQAINQNKFNKK